MHANNLSDVGVFIPSNKFKKYDNDVVPSSAPKKNFFPFFKIEIINNGIFKIKTIVPTGIFNR